MGKTFCGFARHGHIALWPSGKGKKTNDFYTAKIQTAEFYFARLLPWADGHYSAALAPTSAVMQMPQELFQMA